jgi:hypothetical protein
MTRNLESKTSEEAKIPPRPGERVPAANGWLKVGSIAAASALAGGLAAAWFYRKTLSRLREAENEIPDSETGTTEDGRGEDF